MLAAIDDSRAPLTEAIITAVAKLVDDSGTGREPNHSDLDEIISRAGLRAADPKGKGSPVGKAKRIRAVLVQALDFEPSKGERLVSSLISAVRGYGGFMPQTSNFAGSEAIESLRQALQSEGFTLGSDGVLQPAVLDNLSDRQLTQALLGYARRARKGVTDAALVSGTGKDLLEATDLVPV